MTGSLTAQEKKEGDKLFDLWQKLRKQEEILNTLYCNIEEWLRMSYVKTKTDVSRIGGDLRRAIFPFLEVFKNSSPSTIERIRTK